MNEAQFIVVTVGAMIIAFAFLVWRLFRTPQKPPPPDPFEEFADSIRQLQAAIGKEFAPVLQKLVDEMNKLGRHGS